MPRTRVNGLRMHYQQVGSGPHLVLVHGLLCNLAFWYLTVVPALAERFRVTLYDLRGHGYTEGTPLGYRAVDLADDLRALFNHLDIRRAHLVGHSFGGAVALAFAIHHAEQVLSLTLADAWVPTLQPKPLAGSRSTWVRLRRRLKHAGFDIKEEMPRVAHVILEELVRLREARRPEAMAHYNAFGFLADGKRQPLVLRRWQQLVRNTSAVRELSDETGITENEIRAMRRPAVALFGRHSKFLPTLEGLQRNLPDCRSIIVPDAGHFFPILKPKVFTETVTDFIGSAKLPAWIDE